MKTKSISYILNLIFVGIIVFLLLQNQKEVITQNTIIKTDTLIKYDSLLVYKDSIIPKLIIKPTFIHDTIIKYKKDSVYLDYYSIKEYNDTLLDDSTGFFKLQEKLFRNEIVDRQYFFVRRNKTVVQTVQSYKDYKHELYLGIDNSFNNKTKLELNYRINNFLIGSGYNITDNVFTFELKYRLWKK